jgi:hypothetical protein
LMSDDWPIAGEKTLRGTLTDAIAARELIG